MYNKNDKRRIYWLIESYLSEDIDEVTFCDEYYYSYDLEINYDELSVIEQKCFSDLSIVSSRFSESMNDHEFAPKAFSTKKELREKIIEIQHKLKK